LPKNKFVIKSIPKEQDINPKQSNYF